MIFRVLYAMRHRREALALNAGALPLRGDDAHALHALHRMQKVNAAREGPPAIAQRLEECNAPDPRLLRDRRDITAHASARDLQAEQRHPIVEPRQIDELPSPR